MYIIAYPKHTQYTYTVRTSSFSWEKHTVLVLELVLEPVVRTSEATQHSQNQDPTFHSGTVSVPYRDEQGILLVVDYIVVLCIVQVLALGVPIHHTQTQQKRVGVRAVLA